MRPQSSHSCLHRFTPANLRCFLCFLWKECCHLSPALPILTNTTVFEPTFIACLVCLEWWDAHPCTVAVLFLWWDLYFQIVYLCILPCLFFCFLWWCRWTSLIDKLDTAAVWRGSSQWIDACGIACWCKTNKRKRWAWKKRNRCVTDGFFFPPCCRNI